MAKLSANGARALQEFHIDYDLATLDPESASVAAVGGVSRTFYVLRSDGRVLRASSYPNHPGGSYYRKRSGYSIAGKLHRLDGETVEVAFGAFHAAKLRKTPAPHAVSAITPK